MSDESPPPRRNLDQMIAEVAREIALRKNVYPGFVAKKKMRQGDADEHIACMVSVLNVLKWLKEHRGEIVEVRP